MKKIIAFIFFWPICCLVTHTYSCPSSPKTRPGMYGNTEHTSTDPKCLLTSYSSFL
jgi:hypothetical protein